MKSPFDAVTKLQAIIARAKSPDNITWCFEALYDLYKTGALPSGMSLRYLQGNQPGNQGKGFVEEVLYKRDVRDFLLDTWMRAKGGGVFTKEDESLIRAACVSFPAHRQRCGSIDPDGPVVDMSWRASLSEVGRKFLETLETTVFSTMHDNTLAKALRDRKLPEEAIECGTLKSIFEELSEKIEAAIEEKKKQEKAVETPKATPAACSVEDQK